MEKKIDGRGKHGKQGRKRKPENKIFARRVSPEIYKKLTETLMELKNDTK